MLQQKQLVTFTGALPSKAPRLGAGFAAKAAVTSPILTRLRAGTAPSPRHGHERADCPQALAAEGVLSPRSAGGRPERSTAEASSGLQQASTPGKNNTANRSNASISPRLCPKERSSAKAARAASQQKAPAGLEVPQSPSSVLCSPEPMHPLVRALTEGRHRAPQLPWVPFSLAAASPPPGEAPGAVGTSIAPQPGCWMGSQEGARGWPVEMFEPLPRVLLQTRRGKPGHFGSLIRQGARGRAAGGLIYGRL